MLGGYGHLGRCCVRELVQRTGAHVVVAGRSVQRADAVAVGFGDRVRGAYCDARDMRPLRRVLEGADAVVACCGGELTSAISAALSTRVPFVGLSALRLDERSLDVLGETAWKAQVPVVLQAGAVPGLPGVLAESLVRRFRFIRELRIASTGPWQQTETARGDADEARARTTRGLPVRFRFPAPLGSQWLGGSESLDLAGFAGAHCVERLLYLEPYPWLPGRLLEPIAKARSRGPFIVSAEARMDASQHEPEARIDVSCSDAPAAACAVAGSLVEAILARELPAGLLTPREGLPPARILRDLEKSGARISFRGA